MFYNTSEIQNEFSTLTRSRSSQDLALSQKDSELSMISEEIRMRFSRQGAIRKRTVDFNEKQRSSVLNSLIINHIENKEYFSNRNLHRPSLMSDITFQKQSKNYILLSRVKDIWKSLKKDLKDSEQAMEYRNKEDKHNGFLEKKSSLVDESPQNMLSIISDIYRTTTLTDIPEKWFCESSWTEIVEHSETFTKIECDLQASIWELIETESSCLKFLWIIVEVFQPMFCKLQKLFEDNFSIEKEQVFGNIEDVYNSHMELWDKCISLPLLQSRQTKRSLDIMLFKDGFLSIQTIMQSYNTFMRSNINMAKRIQDFARSNSIFQSYVKWTELYSKTYRNGIFSIASVPFQRITKYKLLLTRIKSFTNENQNIDLNEMIISVHDFLENINSNVTGNKRLEEINSKLDINSLIKSDSLDISKLTQDKTILFNLTKSFCELPERVLIHDGQLKLKLDSNKKIDTHCYLFNDLFLICKPFRKDWNKLSIYKGPIRIDKFIVKEETENSFIGFVFNDFSAVDSIFLFIGENDEIKLWIDKCIKTRSSFQKKFASSLQIPNRYFSQQIQVKDNIDTKNDHVSDGTESNKKWNKKHSIASSSSYCSVDSSVSQQTKDSDISDSSKSMLANKHISISSEDSSFNDDNSEIIMDDNFLCDSCIIFGNNRNRLIT